MSTNVKYFLDHQEELQVPLISYLKETDTRIHVVAMHYQCFNTWRHRVGVPQNSKLIRYVTTGTDLRGINPRASNEALIFVCDWMRQKKTPDINDIFHMRVTFEGLGGVIVHDECVRGGGASG